MNELPKRKSIRIGDYDYSTPGAHFITVRTANREKNFRSDRRATSVLSAPTRPVSSPHRAFLPVFT